MKILKGILKTFFWLLILALLIAPVGLIYEISNREMQEYMPPAVPLLRETAYGSVAQAHREDIYEYITVSGTFVSNTYGYMELTQKDPGLIRWDVEVGNEVQEGQVLGTYKGENIVSTLTGILVANNSYSPENAYLKVRLLGPLELECQVSDQILSAIKREGTVLTTEDGKAVTLTYSALVKNPDGTTKIRLSVDSDSCFYGQTLQDLKLMTGRSYLKALVLDENCVYQKTAGDDQPWYARQVTADGQFLKEVTVNIGYQSDGLICVSGVSEGDYFDTGYKSVVAGENGQE